ncbi:DNA-binding protein SMUBP-2-like [Octopus vulgaris]|uniref:DNA-binding protein SMUBP-2-like n=1 Tax=Octopus vulgaris TaxID=6645 RepID=A0AA36BDF2_OCTVU|nr:DNA-binding protein SMUBP-2-like [Octopus vulgaris]
MVEEFVSKTLALLEEERNAEIQENSYFYEKLPPKQLEKKGVCLLKLHLASQASGFYGRMIVKLEPWMKKELPSHSFTPGDIVQLSLNQKNAAESENIAVGIVSKTTSNSISIAFDEYKDIETMSSDAHYKLLKIANDVTYKRLKSAVSGLHKAGNGRASDLLDILFNHKFISSEKCHDFTFYNTNLDESQREAVKFAINQKNIAIIHGPPGTGKTTTVIEILLQAVKQKQKVLVCAPSNIAVDNLVDRLAQLKQNILRIGHPARQLPHLQKYCLDAILSSSDGGKLIMDVKKDLDKAYSQLLKSNKNGEKYKYREEIKVLRKELRQRTLQSSTEILKRADIILSTLTSASDDGSLKELKYNYFDMVVIDECSQATEAACWIPIPRAPKCVLAGDHCQLPPTIISKEAASAGLEITLMERVLKEYGNQVKKMLATQYRMHQHIMEWSSKQLYDNELIADSSVKNHLLKDLERIEENELTTEPLILIDTAGCNLPELEVPEEISKGNEVEEIAVIAPYNLQVELLRLKLSSDYPKLEIKSVDGFQGREKEAVVISLVRSNEKGDVGFLSESRRINVAVTRARRHLTVVCDSETMRHDKFLSSLMDHFFDKGFVYSANQYLNDDIVDRSSLRKLEMMNGIEIGKNANRKKPKPCDEKQNKMSKADKDAKRHNELHKTLTDFSKNSEETVKIFPSTLNSFERMLVHEIANKLGLIHISEGEGKDRQIVVKKSNNEQVISHSDTLENDSSKDLVDNEPIDNEPVDSCTGMSTVSSSNCDDNTTTNQAMSIDSTTNQAMSIDSTTNQAISIDSSELLDESLLMKEKQNKKTKKVKKQNKSVPVFDFDKPAEDTVTCSYCSRQILKSNYDLHILHCSKSKKPNTKTSKPTQMPKVKAKSDKMTKALNSVDPDDFDALISAAMEVNNKCSFPKCKEKTHVLRIHCEFCRLHYCISHSMPEIHGCGAEIKAQARKIISRDGVIYSGSGVPSKLPNAVKSARLQSKLDKRLTEMSDQRKQKQKKS